MKYCVQEIFAKFLHFYIGTINYYSKSLYGDFEDGLECQMDHDYIIQVTVNNGWCSFSDGNQPRVQRGDLQSKSLIKIHGTPKFQDELFYKFRIQMEHVK